MILIGIFYTKLLQKICPSSSFFGGNCRGHCSKLALEEGPCFEYFIWGNMGWLLINGTDGVCHWTCFSSSTSPHPEPTIRALRTGTCLKVTAISLFVWSQMLWGVCSSVNYPAFWTEPNWNFMDRAGAFTVFLKICFKWVAWYLKKDNILLPKGECSRTIPLSGRL